MADDVKVLREFIEDIDYYDGTTTDTMKKVLYVIAKRMADMIEREAQWSAPECKCKDATRGWYTNEFDQKTCAICNEPMFDNPTPDALQAAEDRGWNAAIEAARQTVLTQLEWREAAYRSFLPNLIRKRTALTEALCALRRGPAS